MTAHHSGTTKKSRGLLMPQDFPLRCDKCGKIYTEKAKDAFLKNKGGSITCTGCPATREFPVTTKVVLLQPVIISNGGRDGILLVASDGARWTFPNGRIRINESAEDTLIRTAQESFGITPSPNSLRHFFADSNPLAQEYLSFYYHTTRLHERDLPTKITDSKTFLIIQTTAGIAFPFDLYRYAAEKFLFEIWFG